MVDSALTSGTRPERRKNSGDDRDNDRKSSGENDPCDQADAETPAEHLQKCYHE